MGFRLLFFTRSILFSVFRHFAVLIILCCFVCPGTLAAQQPKEGAARQSGPDPEKPAKMEEVVVTASRYAEEVSRVPANVSVITEQDIRNSTAASVPELLRALPGIQVSDTGNRRKYTVDLRGFGETAALNSVVLVDGRRVTQADLSGTDWTQIPLDRVKRIEILRGGRGAVLYGDNATGGAINIITKDGGRNRAGFDAAAGSYKTYTGSAFAEGKNDGLSYALNSSYLNSNGYRLNSDVEASDLGANLKFFPTDTTILSFSSGYHKENDGLPGALKESDLRSGISRKDSIYPNDFAKTEDRYVKGGLQKYLWGDNYFNFDASVRIRDFSSFASFVGGNFTGDTNLTNFILTPQFVFMEKIGRFGNKLTIGFDYVNSSEDIENTSLFFGTASTANYDLSRIDYGYYIFDEIEILKGLTLSGGYRQQRAEYSFNPGPGGEVTKKEHAWSAGVNYNIRDSSQVYFSFARSFRYPVLDELFSFFTNTVSDIDPQVSYGYELGARHRFPGNVQAGVNLFYVKTSDEIFFNPYTYTNMNLDDDTYREGIELFADWKAREWLTLYANFTYTRAKIDGGQFDGKWVPGVPEKKYSAGANFTITKALSLGVSGTYVGSRPFISDFANAFPDQESYYFIDAKLQYKWRNLTAYLNLNNITDKKYSEYGGIVFNQTTFVTERGYYPSPTANFMAGLKAEF